jgi:hypothetical protein
MRPSGVFLVVKEVGSEGRRADLEATEPPEAAGSFIFLCHAPDMTLLEEQLAGAHLGSGAREPLGIGSMGLVFLCPGLGWHR